ncbi:retrovirus-related pol polyprotein from transposon TNT 1-94 [Tanacetum coccineum]
MLAPNPSSYYNGRASFVNPMYLKKAQSAKPCLYKVPYDKDDLVNIFAPNCDETLIIEEERNVTIKRVYYIEGNNYNLFSIGQFFDADIEVAFRKSTCYIRDLQGNDLLKAKASPTQAWLWHRRLSHLNFDTINLLSNNDIVHGLPKLKFVKDQMCSSCEMGKAKNKFFQVINHYKIEETAQFITVRTDRGTEFLNKTLHAYFKEEGIEHQTSTPQTPEQTGVVERWNHTLVKAARMMLSAF